MLELGLRGVELRRLRRTLKSFDRPARSAPSDAVTVTNKLQLDEGSSGVVAQRHTGSQRLEAQPALDRPLVPSATNEGGCCGPDDCCQPGDCVIIMMPMMIILMPVMILIINMDGDDRYHYRYHYRYLSYAAFAPTAANAVIWMAFSNDKANWNKIFKVTSSLGAAKILAGIVLLATNPHSASHSPSAPYAWICIFLGVAWIARGWQLKNTLPKEPLLPTHSGTSSGTIGMPSVNHSAGANDSRANDSRLSLAANDSSETDHIEATIELFNIFDANCDGVLDKVEYETYLRGIGQWHRIRDKAQWGGWDEGWPKECEELGRTAAEGIDWSAFKGNLYGQKRVGKAQQDLFFYKESESCEKELWMWVVCCCILTAVVMAAAAAGHR